MPPPVRIAYSVERRIPASLLLIAAEIDVANMVYGTLERALGSRVCVWHEPALAPALKVLAACRFRLILFDLTLRTAYPGSALRSIKDAAPDTPLALLMARPKTPLSIERAALGDAEARLAGAVAVVRQGEPDGLVRVVRQVLGMPARSGEPSPTGSRGPDGADSRD